MVYDDQLNPAISTSHVLIIPKYKHLTYHVQVSELPGWNMAGVETPFRNNQGRLPSNRIDFPELNISFQVDEDWKNWEAMFHWAKEIRTGGAPITEVMTDMTLVLTDSNKRPKMNIIYRGAFPTMIGQLPLDTTTTDANPIQVSATFAFQDFELQRP